MAVRRVVANIAANRLKAAEAFYGGVLEMRVVTDLGWIVTFAAEGTAVPQISVAREGGSGTSVPDLSIEVDDLDAVHRRAVAGGFAIEYGPVVEPWGCGASTSGTRSGGSSTSLLTCNECRS